MNSEKKNNLTKEENGSITVWLTLLSLMVMTFIIVVIECVRIINAQNICSNSANLATMSLMADYDLDVYENYGLYVMGRDIDEMTFRKYAQASLYSKLFLKEMNVKKIHYMDNKHMEQQILRHSTIKDYLLENFTSFKKPYVKGFMDRKYSYELEYIIGGKEKDNDNINIIKSKLKNKEAEEVVNELNLSDEEYESYVIDFIEQIDRNKMYNRMREIIIHNVNATFNKNLDNSKLIVGIDILSKYRIETYLDNNLIKGVFNKINNKCVININSQYRYDKF